MGTVPATNRSNGASCNDGMEEDTDIEIHLNREYDPVEVNTSISLNKEVREWNENRNQSRHCAVPLLRTIFSIVAHIGFIGCVGVTVWYVEAQTKDPDNDHHFNYPVRYSISIVMAVLLYVGILVEAASSTTYSYMKNYADGVTACQYLDSTRAACPLIKWHATCYHYEPSNLLGHEVKNANVNQTRNKEKVITAEEFETFRFNKWRDLTKDIKGLFRLPVIRLECSKIFIFRDENTKERYMKQYIAFREKCRSRDEFMEHEEIFTIPGYRDRLLLCSDIPRRPFWLRESVFWMLTVLLLTWPYRIFFARRSTQVYVVFIKELEA